MSLENSQSPEILIEWIGKRKRRAVGSQVWSSPVRKNKFAPVKSDGTFAPDNIILDCSISSNRIILNGNTVQILSTDPQEKKDAILQLAGYGTANGDVWGVLKEGDNRQLYRVTKVAEAEEKRLLEAEEKFKYQEKVFAMKDEEFREYALLLGIQGSLSLIKVTLGQTYFEKGNESLKRNLIHYLDMDDEERMMTIALLSASKLGNPNTKTGVHQRSTGLYYNDRRLGVDIQDAIVSILNSTDRVELMTAIKAATLSNDKIEKPAKTGKK